MAWLIACVLAFAPPPPTFPPHGGAYVTTLPGSASAWLDGTYVGTTPFYADDLAPGRHSVTLSTAGWQPATATFDVTAGRVTPVSVVMSRVPAPGNTQGKGQGALAIGGAPAGAKVYVDGGVVGTAPVGPRTLGAGYHIVTVQPQARGAVKETRVVDIYPGVTTALIFAPPAAGQAPQSPADDVLEPVDRVVADNAVMIAGDEVIIHYRGMEIECAIGARAYRFNGRAGTLAVPPAMVGGKLYLPESLLARLSGNR